MVPRHVLLLSILLFILMIDRGSCCPKKLKSITTKISDKFKSLKKSDTDAATDQASKARRSSVADNVDNVDCKNPFFPCNELDKIAKKSPMDTLTRKGAGNPFETAGKSTNPFDTAVRKGAGNPFDTVPKKGPNPFDTVEKVRKTANTGPISKRKVAIAVGAGAGTVAVGTGIGIAASGGKSKSPKASNEKKEYDYSVHDKKI